MIQYNQSRSSNTKMLNEWKLYVCSVSPRAIPFDRFQIKRNAHIHLISRSSQQICHIYHTSLKNFSNVPGFQILKGPQHSNASYKYIYHQFVSFISNRNLHLKIKLLIRIEQRIYTIILFGNSNRDGHKHIDVLTGIFSMIIVFVARIIIWYIFCKLSLIFYNFLYLNYPWESSF